MHQLRPNPSKAKARILARLEAVKPGNLGDVKTVGGGIRELRIPVGPGYKVYFAQSGRTIPLLSCGGDKSTQVRDIAKALRLLRDIAKARGMGAIAEGAGLGRKSLHEVLTPGAKPRYDTVLKLLQSLGIKLSVTAAQLPQRAHA